jgi:hypothetical protein
VTREIVCQAAAIVMVSILIIAVTGITIRDDDKVFILDLFNWSFFDFCVLLFFHFILLRVVRG